MGPSMTFLLTKHYDRHGIYADIFVWALTDRRNVHAGIVGWYGLKYGVPPGGPRTIPRVA